MSETIYFAAGLFNASDKIFNKLLTQKLENRGYNIILPQRDGFEFVDFYSSLCNVLGEKNISFKINNLIYFLDLGEFMLKKSDKGIFRFDEPMDPGVDWESGFAKLINLPSIGYRTDIRSPYGSLEDDTGGSHFFPIYGCDKFILAPMNPLESIEKYSDKLAEILYKNLKELKKRNKNLDHPYSQKIAKATKILFGDLENIHSKKNLRELALRYKNNEKFLESILPSRIKI